MKRVGQAAALTCALGSASVVGCGEAPNLAPGHVNEGEGEGPPQPAPESDELPGACLGWDDYVAVSADPAALPPVGSSGFVDVAKAAGISHRQARNLDGAPCLFEIEHQGGGFPQGPLCDPERMTGGAAVGDFDNDGWEDLYVTRFGATDVLYRNRGDGTFEDVTDAVGLGGCSLSNGVAWTDIDADGDLDLVMTTVGAARNLLFVNEGEQGFSEQALARGVALDEDGVPHFGTSVIVGDYDTDGYDDLFLLEWRPHGAVGDAPSFNRLLHNRGAQGPGTFEDVTHEAGVELDGSGSGVWALSGAFADLDADRRPDLVVVSDFGTSQTFRNLGEGRFEDITSSSGMGLEDNGMGIALGDVDRDGRIDVFVTAIGGAACPGCNATFSGNRLYRNRGGFRFDDVAPEWGVADGGWGWGATFIDFDNDGRTDLAMTNGWNVEQYENAPSVLWRATDHGMSEVNPGLAGSVEGRAVVWFDYDRDGDQDVFVVGNADAPRLFRNDRPNSGSWIDVEVRGANGQLVRDARVVVQPGPGSPSIHGRSGLNQGFLGHGSEAVHFGLGADNQTVARVTVHWPQGGPPTKLDDVAANRTLVIVHD